jgi:hypothetical protein
MLIYGCLITVISAFLITTVESSASDEKEINYTILVINRRMRKVLGNLINVETN